MIYPWISIVEVWVLIWGYNWRKGTLGIGLGGSMTHRFTSLAGSVMEVPWEGWGWGGGLCVMPLQGGVGGSIIFAIPSDITFR